MNGQIIRNARLYCEYGNCLRSLPRLNLTIIRFESDDSQKKKYNFKELLTEDKPKLESRGSYKKKKVHDSLSRDIFFSMEKKEKLSCGTEDEKSQGDYKMKLKQLFGSEETKETSSPLKTITVQKPIRKPKGPVNQTESEKKKFFSFAKEVALELKIDVSTTQDDLYTHYIKTEETKHYSKPEHELIYNYETPSQTKKILFDEFRTIEGAGYLDIFEVPPKKEEEGRYEPTTAPEGESEGKSEVGESIEKIQKEAGEVKLEVWKALRKIDMDESLYTLPTNYFDELIHWTEIGKLHRFPIDNEQDWHEEHSTDFTEHIFLEEHLEPWCPKTGPLRHFMELITTGLSKNPYLSAKKKVEHLTWYRDYFFEKSSLLKEVGIQLNVEE